MKRLILLALGILFLATLSIAQSKVALVIGNADYAKMPLKNPENDAYDLAGTLSSLGFDVIRKTNLDQRQMEDAIRDFSGKLNPGDVALFYYSGHGTQVEGLNYLIPVNERMQQEIDAKYNCVEAGFVLDHMEQARSGVNIIILDACRNNPFKGYRSANKGFAFMSAPTGSIIAYSTAPGKVAQDGTGRNSPFTHSLIEKINVPGLKVEEVFKEVRKDVANKTGKQQIPWESSSLMGDFYFKGGDGDRPADYQAVTYESTTKPEPRKETTAKSGYFTDPRDGQRYKWVRIGEQVWMAENLNYKTGDSWCYDNKTSNCNKYGRLYTWGAARKACPNGWHLPGDDEWKKLEKTIGSKAGNKLKSKTGWKEEGKGSDAFGFAALPAGSRYYNGFFLTLGYYAIFWSSSEFNSNLAWSRRLFSIFDEVFRGDGDKSYGFSVRCLRD